MIEETSLLKNITVVAFIDCSRTVAKVKGLNEEEKKH
jgi:hypothetical protein